MNLVIPEMPRPSDHLIPGDMLFGPGSDLYWIFVEYRQDDLIFIMVDALGQAIKRNLPEEYVLEGDIVLLENAGWEVYRL